MNDNSVLNYHQESSRCLTAVLSNGVTKYVYKLWQIQKVCVYLPLRNSREYTTTKDIFVSCSKKFGRSLVAYYIRVVVTVSQKLRGYALFLYPYINQIFDPQCETVSKMRIQGIIVPTPHLPT